MLFLKVTDAGLQLIDEPVLAPAYPGSKEYLRIDQDDWYIPGRLAALVKVTADASLNVAMMIAPNDSLVFCGLLLAASSWAAQPCFGQRED